MLNKRLSRYVGKVKSLYIEKGILILFFCLLLSNTYAQWSNDPTINIPLSDTLSSGSALSPKAVSDGNGGAIIVWSRTQIHGQRVSSTGNKLWGQFTDVIVGTSGDPTTISYLINPVAVSDDSGGAIIAWAEYNSGRIIGASRVRPDGLKAWDKLVRFTTSLCKNPSITSDGEGGAIVTWEDSRNGTNNSDIYAQRISASGVMMWDSNGVAVCEAVQNQTVPRIASDGMGGVFITWSDNRVSDSRIYAQLISSLGQVQWEPTGMLICAPSNDPAANPRIAAIAIGEAIITWTHGAGGTWDVNAQKVNQDTVQWKANGVTICNEIRTQWKPEIAADGIGGAIISWQDTRRISFNEEDVYAQKITSDGLVQWGQNGIPVCTQPGNSNVPHSITSDGDGGAIIAWEDQRNGNTDIYAQRVHRIGSTMWTQDGVAVSTAQYSQAGVTLIANGNGGAILAWYDGRRGTYLDIYGQGVDTTGALGGTTDIDDNESTPMEFSLQQNYPNPFNPSTTIQYAIDNRQFISLKVYDVLGNEVATLVNEEKPAGSYEVLFEGSHLSSGVYIYRLQSGSYSESKKLILIR